MILLVMLFLHTTNQGTVEIYSTDLNGASQLEAIIQNPYEFPCTPPQQMPGWPQNMGGGGTFSPSGVSFTDVDGDGYLEIIAGCPNGTFHVWDYQGNELPGWPKTGLEAIQSKAAVGDIDPGYPGLEIMVAGRTNTLYAWHNDGTNVSGWPQSVGETGGFKSPVLFDLDGDDYLEIILGQRYYPTGRVLVFNHDGTAYPNWPQSLDYMCVATPSIGDVDNDDVMEICAVSFNSVYLWDRDGNLKPGWPKLNAADGMSYAQPVIADLDDDDDFEILHSYYTNSQNYVGIYHHDGTNFTYWPQTYPGPQTYTMPITGDIDSDDDLEIFGGGHVWGGLSLSARHHTGAQVSGWPVIVTMLECSPIVFDLDDDGDREVLVGDNATPGNFYAFHGNGSIVTDWPISITAATLVNSAAVGDVDRDGDIEIALVVADGTVNLWTLDGIQYRGYLTDWATFFHDDWNTGWLHPAPPQNLTATGFTYYIYLSWDTNTEPDIAGYNVYRCDSSGGPYEKINDTLITDTTYSDYAISPGFVYYYCVTAQTKAYAESRVSNEVTAAGGVAETEVEPISPISISPNPFAHSIEFSIPTKRTLKIKIYDAKGSLVDEIRGIESIEWKPEEFLPVGVYFAEIGTEKGKTLEKIIKIK